MPRGQLSRIAALFAPNLIPTGPSLKAPGYEALSLRLAPHRPCMTLVICKVMAVAYGMYVGNDRHVYTLRINDNR
jgi:hypothetical protein